MTGALLRNTQGYYWGTQVGILPGRQQGYRWGGGGNCRTPPLLLGDSEDNLVTNEYYWAVGKMCDDLRYCRSDQLLLGVLGA